MSVGGASGRSASRSPGGKAEQMEAAQSKLHLITQLREGSPFACLDYLANEILSYIYMYSMQYICIYIYIYI